MKYSSQKLAIMKLLSQVPKNALKLRDLPVEFPYSIVNLEKIFFLFLKSMPFLSNLV